MCYYVNTKHDSDRYFITYRNEHIYSYGIYDATYHQKICDICGTTSLEAHSLKPVPGTNTSMCTVCGSILSGDIGGGIIQKEQDDII